MPDSKKKYQFNFGVAETETVSVPKSSGKRFEFNFDIPDEQSDTVNRFDPLEFSEEKLEPIKNQSTNFPAATEAINHPGRMANEGLSEIGSGEVISGGLKVLQGVAHTAFTPVTVPLALLDDVLRSVGLSDPADALNYVFNLPAEGYKKGEKLIDAEIGDTKFAEEFNKGMSAYLLSKGVSLKEQGKIKKELSNIGQLTSTLLAFKKAHDVGGKLTPKQNKAPLIRSDIAPEKILPKAESQTKDLPSIQELKTIKSKKEPQKTNTFVKQDAEVKQKFETAKQEKTAEVKGEKRYSIKNRIVNAERQKRGLEPLEKEFTREWGKVGEEALKKLEKGEVDPHKLARELTEKPRPHTDTEAFILAYEKVRLGEERSKLSDQMAETKDPKVYDKLYKESLRLDELYYQNEVATHASGSEAGRALNARKAEIYNDYTIAPLKYRARQANKGNEIPAEVNKKLETASRQIKEAEERARIAEEKVAELSAREYVDELTVAEANARKAVSRRRTKATLDAEYNQLIKDFASTVKLNALVDPQQIKIVSLMTKNRVQKGLTEINDIVSSIHSDLKQHMDGLSKRDVMDAVGGYGKYRKLSKEEINVQLRDLKRQARLLSAIDDVKTQQKAPKKTGFERDQLSKRAKELERQLKEEMDKAGLKRGATMESLRQSYETRLKNRKAELENMLRKGDYTKKPRRSVQLDKNLQKLKDEVDVLKIKVDKEIYLLEQKNRTLPQKVKDWSIEVANVPRTLKASFDLSAPFRQGAFALVNHPKIAFGKGGAFREMFTYFGSDQAIRKLGREINESPNAALYHRSGLYLANSKTTLGKIAGREEPFISSIPEKIPGIGMGVRASERAYVGFLDKLRKDIFDFQTEQLKRSGYTFKDRPDLYKATAKLINIATGRGTLGGFERAAAPLSIAMFSPRLVASRFQLLSPTTYLKLPKELRARAAMDFVRFAGFGTTMAMLAQMAGAEVETDPRSTDFMKIKIGNTRLDIWAGLQQPTVAISRVSPSFVGGGKTKNSLGKMVELDGKTFPFTTRYDVGLRFAESKASPAMGLFRDLMKGKTFMGEELTAENIALDMVTPLYFKDFYEAYKLDGIQGALLSVPGFFGTGVGTYKAKSSYNFPHYEGEPDNVTKFLEERDIKINKPGRATKLKGLKMTDETYEKYVKMVGEETHKEMRKYLPKLRGMKTERAKDFIEKRISSIVKQKIKQRLK